MEPSETQAVGPERARDQPREDESFELSGRTPAEAPWSTAHKVAFRFAFSYLFLYVFPLSVTFAWLWDLTFAWLGGLTRGIEIYESLWHKVVPWFAAHILHLRYPITVIGQSADSTYDNVKVLCFVLIAALATVVWSVIDRKRTAYSKLNEWTRLYVRLVLASAMFAYGSDKVIPLQMPPPSLSTLMQPFGDLTPYRLLWSFMGASTGYQVFCGLVEMLGGVLLLIPGTTMLGALISLGALANVFMLNVCYDIPVKFWALHLILFASFLLLPDLRRLVNLFVLNRGAEPERRRPLFRRRWLNYSVWGIQWALGIYFIAVALPEQRTDLYRINAIPLTNPLYGIWRVDEFTADGQVRPPLLTDNMRWQRVIFTSTKALTIQEMNGLFSPYAVTMDTQKSTLSLKSIKTAGTSSPWWSEWDTNSVTSYHASLDASWRWRSDIELNYNRPQPEAMILEGLMDGHRLRVTLKKEERQFILKTRGSRWINDEYDFYNEYVDQVNVVP